MTRFIYLIGYPLKHSISPDFQQAALDYHGIDVRYELREIEERLLPSVVEGLRAPQNLGANVTVPYKEKVVHFVDSLDDLARAVGAVNTIVNEDGNLKGYNTDVDGFLSALSRAGFEPRGKIAVVLGAGGAARAVCFALIREGLAMLMVANRTRARAERLVEDLSRYARETGLVTQIAVVPWEEDWLKGAVSRCQLVVNCTTVGMKHTPEEGSSPLTQDMLSSDVLVYDLVYNPRETPLLKMAKGVGAKTIDGLAMLVYQGAAAFRLWTGEEPPLDIMFRAAERALAMKGG